MPDTSFQRFPRNVEKQNYWIKNMKINRTLPSSTKVFWKNKERWFYYTKNSHSRRRLLLREAAPFMFPSLPTHLRPKKVHSTSLHKCLNKRRESVHTENFKMDCKESPKTVDEITVSTSEERKPRSMIHSEASTSNLETFCMKPVDKYEVFVIKQSNTESQNMTHKLVNQNTTTEEEPPRSSPKTSVDEYEALGISWVAQLRKLTEPQKVLAAGLISQVLQKAYFEDLTKNTRINDTLTSGLLSNSPPTTISFPSSHSSYCIEGESNSNLAVGDNRTTKEEITMDTEVVFMDAPERIFITCSKGNTS